MGVKIGGGLDVFLPDGTPVQIISDLGRNQHGTRMYRVCVKQDVNDDGAVVRQHARDYAEYNLFSARKPVSRKKSDAGKWAVSQPLGVRPE